MTTANTRATPIQAKNRVKSVEKQGDGSMRVWLHNGKGYIIPATETTMQAFVVYTVLVGH